MLETPYFTDAWEDNDDEEARKLSLVPLDKHAESMKKLPYGGHYPDSMTMRNVKTPLIRRRSDDDLHKQSRGCLRIRLMMIPMERIWPMAMILATKTTMKVNSSRLPVHCSILASYSYGTLRYGGTVHF
jgi:hypothetical protein